MPAGEGRLDCLPQERAVELEPVRQKPDIVEILHPRVRRPQFHHRLEFLGHDGVNWIHSHVGRREVQQRGNPYDDSREQKRPTTTRGIILRPLHKFIKLPFGAEFALGYNRSDTFQANVSNFNPWNEAYPGASGTGEDKSIRLGLFDGRFNLRLTQFDNTAGPQRAGNVPYRMKSGVLALFWASWSKDRLYAESIAYSDNGKLSGPWRHEPAPMLQDDVGHGSVFTAFDGRLLLVIHKYFKQPATRVQIYELEEFRDRIRVKNQILGAP